MVAGELGGWGYSGVYLSKLQNKVESVNFVVLATEKYSHVASAGWRGKLSGFTLALPNYITLASLSLRMVSSWIPELFVVRFGHHRYHKILDVSISIDFLLFSSEVTSESMRI